MVMRAIILRDYHNVNEALHDNAQLDTIEHFQPFTRIFGRSDSSQDVSQKLPNHFGAPIPKGLSVSPTRIVFGYS